MNILQGWSGTRWPPCLSALQEPESEDWAEVQALNGAAPVWVHPLDEAQLFRGLGPEAEEQAGSWTVTPRGPEPTPTASEYRPGSS